MLGCVRVILVLFTIVLCSDVTVKLQTLSNIYRRSDRGRGRKDNEPFLYKMRTALTAFYLEKKWPIVIHTLKRLFFSCACLIVHIIGDTDVILCTVVTASMLEIHCVATVRLQTVACGINYTPVEHEINVL